MSKNLLSSLFGRAKADPCIALDIGSSSVKMMSLETSGGSQKLLSLGMAPLAGSCFSNHSVSKPDQVAQVIRSIIESNDIRGSNAVVALPGPAVFTKRITIAYSDLKTLSSNIAFEAGNYVPYSLDAVHLDFQVLKTNQTSSMDVLLVAVKNEIINSYIAVAESAGLQPVIADVDYFALENMFEGAYPEAANKTIALVNIGSRYSSVNIIQDGESLFYGDVSVGGRLYTEALVETLNMSAADAQKAQLGVAVNGFDQNLVSETLDRTTEHIASELHRQLGFFWNAAATERSIEELYLTGGGSTIPGLLDELGIRTGISCVLIEPFRGIEFPDSFDREYLDELKPFMAVSVGLARRRLGDKVQS